MTTPAMEFVEWHRIAARTRDADSAETALAFAIADWKARPRHSRDQALLGELHIRPMVTEAQARYAHRYGTPLDQGRWVNVTPFCETTDNIDVTTRESITLDNEEQLAEATTDYGRLLTLRLSHQADGYSLCSVELVPGSGSSLTVDVDVVRRMPAPDAAVAGWFVSIPWGRAKA